MSVCMCSSIWPKWMGPFALGKALVTNIFLGILDQQPLGKLHSNNVSLSYTDKESTIVEPIQL